MSKFDHKNVLSMHGMTIIGNQPCVIMPFLKNGNLSEYLRQQLKRITFQVSKLQEITSKYLIID